MDEKNKNFAKMRIKTVLSECVQVGMTPEELYTEITSLDIPLVNDTIDTMFRRLGGYTHSQIIQIIKVLMSIIQADAYVLDLFKQDTSTSNKVIEYMNKAVKRMERDL